jgi:hypothetical protein
MPDCGATTYSVVELAGAVGEEIYLVVSLIAQQVVWPDCSGRFSLDMAVSLAQYIDISVEAGDVHHYRRAANIRKKLIGEHAVPVSAGSIVSSIYEGDYEAKRYRYLGYKNNDGIEHRLEVVDGFDNIVGSVPEN